MLCFETAFAQSELPLLHRPVERHGFLSPPDPGAGIHTKRILLLQERGLGSPSGLAFDVAFANEVRAFGLDLYAEVVEQSRFPGDGYAQAVRSYLRRKYENRTFDVVVAVGVASLTLARENRAMFGNPSIVAVVGASGYINTDDGVTGLEAARSVGGTIDLSLAMRPNTRRVVVLDSARVNQSVMESEFRRRVADRPQLSLEYLRNLSIDDAVARAAALSEDTVLHFVKQSMRNQTEDMDQVEALTQVSRASRAPVFVHFEDLIGHGALGGHVWQAGEDAARVASIAKQLAFGAKTADFPVAESAHRNVVDWRQMQRWQIPEARLPAGSVVLHRPVSMFGRRPHVFGGAVLLVVQLLLVSAILAQRRRRRAAEATAVEGKAEVQRARRRNHELAGRLLTAQEAERSRIARDLHNGVCQEVASVVVDLSNLRRNIAGAEAQETLLALQRRATGVAETLRLLSHHLHPSVLHHIGLVAALQAYCSEAQREYGMKVELFSQPDVEPSDKKTSLALFRIAQEAIRNATQHGRARRATLSLERDGMVLVMAIVDDGGGFDVSAARGGGGLGLLSIEEHARLARGQALVHSRPGRTAVEVFVPLENRDAYHTSSEDIAC
ncbi:MAG: ABC transporter substrate binding protein [Vicinamibacterales bacterium]